MVTEDPLLDPSADHGFGLGSMVLPEAWFSALVRNSTDLITILQADGRRTFISSTVERILGYTPADLLRQDAFALIHPEDRATVQAAFLRTLQQPGINVPVEFRTRHANGSWVYLESIGNNLLTDPVVQGVVINSRDITLRRTTERLLRQQHDRERIISAIALKVRQSFNLREILETAVAEVQQVLQADRVLIFRFTPTWEGEVLVESVAPGWFSTLHALITDTCFRANQGGAYRQGRVFATEDIYKAGLTPCHLELLEQFQVRANLVVPIIQGEPQSGVDALWGLLIAHQCSQPRSWQPYETELLTALSTHLAIALQQAELLQRVQEELTERQRVAQELRKSLDKEKELSELKTRFIAMASHEFRTPLTAILSCSDLLKHYGERLPPQERTRLFTEIQTEVQHMNRLLEDILIFGRTETHGLDFNPQPIDLEPFCQDLLQKLVSPNPLHFTLEHPIPKASLDPKLLRQILTNLLDNAIKYSPQGGTVVLTVQRQPQAVVFQVRDEGIGIPPEDRARLFEPFHRAHNTDGIPGTGLGLAIVYKAVARHGGSITVHSQLGYGTTFTVTLPLT
ncbi:sensor histidine kinase [Anthocerotibacter panamensis]|uniref:sensor histidine kinase n=1 Tax=Anthocerotibacter panamensis TaxID=2857077 RepID=UPI001C406621|nr:ATP-binding protein [Anthocerotibacter panamensis]